MGRPPMVFEKYGRPTGRPIMYLDSSFVRIFLMYVEYFLYYWHSFIIIIIIIIGGIFFIIGGFLKLPNGNNSPEEP